MKWLDEVVISVWVEDERGRREVFAINWGWYIATMAVLSFTIAVLLAALWRVG